MSESFRPAMPIVLSIAGSDCSGGAGIQADIKTCAASGVYCPTAITAITAQNPSGVQGVEYVGDDMLRLQLKSILESIQPDAVKIGMIPCASAAGVIAEVIDIYGLGNIVIDPVLSATSGGSLSRDTSSTAETTARLLFSKAVLVTPNIPELFRLQCIEENEDIDNAALTLMHTFAIKNLLVKGGHSVGRTCTDKLYGNNGKCQEYHSERIATRHTHGTGCTLSSSIACGLAKGLNLFESIASAKGFITGAIKRGSEHPVFKDNGPLLH